mmetsp:Transcript_27565/g.55097  ORF Transcript_27565/g.55097 Transcript_27565/m.55097 type:complete len:399 (-) Transcript_27565:99-1295(-)|eukprot:CAMPEP_0182470016 /NCGR_PEP_ID=MMETSP1319-20130603/17994_1 /TAXON_ID=172717 /ORGANISM="Bolidomonas pacifica, Strain RCC208" /LENGTH=398 /DNA_ID=CAMNT_0024670401 /DNA_START=140 /DNA_END=1336 /DNA_ORIENTATION=+
MSPPDNTGTPESVKRSSSFFGLDLSPRGAAPRQLRRTLSLSQGLHVVSPEKARDEPSHLAALDVDCHTCHAVEAANAGPGRAKEVTTFLGWMLVYLVSVVSIPMLWVALWRSVVRAPKASMPQAFIFWCTGGLCAYYYRSVVKGRSPQVMRPILVHAELFMCASMFCTISANVASLMHEPGERLRDVGFMLVPEQAVDSAWRPLSDVLTIALPFFMAGYALLFCTRKERSQVFVDWFRLVAIAYLMRSVTLVLTSLPGPAPHCNPKFGDEYDPPKNYIDILTRLGPLYGSFNTCGDLLFSGHASWTTMTLLICLRMTRHMRYPRIRAACAGIYLITMMVFAIAGRKHYTVDLVLAVIISSLSYCQFEKGWRPRAAGPTSPRALAKLGAGSKSDFPQVV